ncbi:MAG: efflux RND transporter permease subunit, partial [Bacteroidota bacterium]
MRRIVTYFTQYTVWSNAIIILVVILGLLSMFSIKKAFFPEIDPNLVVVRVAYPGASPEEMEEGVVNKVEESLKGIQGIDEVNSTSLENLAYVQVEVSSEYDPDLVLTDVKNAVDRINSFPVSAEKPVVLRQKPQGDAIDIILVGDVDLVKLKETAEAVRFDLLAAEGISQVAISGYPALEIEITVPEETLRRFGLTFDQVAQAVRDNNRDISSGSVKTTEEEILIRSRAKQYDAEGIGQIIVRTNRDGSILRLSDLATITPRFADVPNASYYNGQLSATLKITKLPEEDVLVITDYVKAYVEEFNQNNRSVEAILENDRSVVLNNRLAILIENGAVGLILVLVMLGLFLSLRLSFWVAFGIPFSFLGMLFVADLMGVSINLISLFGMIMVVGILVDDGIVVGENIFAHFEKGKSPLRASVDGTMEVMGSVFTGVTTTMLTFSAFFFFEGRLGQFLYEMAVVVILCLAFSLLECYFILPPHLAHSGALKKKKPNRVRKAVDKLV